LLHQGFRHQRLLREPLMVDLNADHSAYLLGPVTDRLINEVLA